MGEGRTEDQEEKPLKVEKWDHNAVRIALDDAAKKIVLDNLGYVEDFKLIDGRLLICTAAVGFALFALLWDFLHPFPESKTVLITCVLSYFALMGVLTVYANFIEKTTFLLAREKDKAGVDPDIVWKFSSKMPKYDDNYTLTIATTPPEGSERSADFTRSAGEFFDEDGLLTEKFEAKVMELYRSLEKGKKMQ